MKVDQLIDQFVVVVAAAGNVLEPIDNAPWITELEQRLPRRLPASFRYLVTRYAFPPIEIGELSLFGNMGTDDPDEMSIAIFRDRFIADRTLKAGYIQFAHPTTGSYDPVCFDTRSSVNNREFPIVRLDHEAILCRDSIYVRAKLAESFFQFAKDIVSRA